MDSPVWVQIASLVVVLLALLVSTYQVLLARRQTKSLQQTTEAALTAGQAEARHQILYANPDLMAWHLRTRGCEGRDEQDNRRRYFIIQKLISDEALFIGNLRGFISDESWHGWIDVVKQDACNPEARQIWPEIRFMYAEEFVRHIEALHGEIKSVSMSEPVTVDAEVTADRLRAEGSRESC
ncbi:hypothetical protein [Pseudonocardia pini]|uniref:hypothetical protein n=1 Tax=Pseudonocardia pini TaxID=2758030 RepID=UPI0015F103F9|nr:hypothetical protein [Pseudonocardia pini]